MATTNEYIEYRQVQEGAEEIRECAARMDEVFRNMSSNMNRMGEDWIGKASNTVQSNYSEMAANFRNYIQTVERFANLYSNAARTLEEGEHRINQQAQNL